MITRQTAQHTHEIVDGRTGCVIGRYSSLLRAHHAADKKDLAYGAIRYRVRRIEKTLADTTLTIGPL